MWLLIVFIAVPLIEIALFIQVGGWLGLWPTLLIVLVTAILGTTLVRSQGAQALGQLRSSLGELRDPAEPLANGAMILFAGALLLTPGFFTDAVGFALLVPGVRKRLFGEIKSRVKVQTMEYGNTQQHRPRPAHGDVIDGEAHEVEIKPRNPDQPASGWTRGGGGDRPKAD